MKPPTSPTPSTSSYNHPLLGYMNRQQSPLPPPVSAISCLSATSKFYKYLRRLLKFRQMDFEFAIWQIVYLFISPQKVYRNFHYRKHTKSQFARDDPAFLVVLLISLCVTSIGIAWVLGLGFGQFLVFLLYVIFIDCLFSGIVMATIFWFATNRWMRLKEAAGGDSDVEWGYAFDVHLNAFYPPLIILHFFQLFFYHALINQDWFISRFLGNTLWLLAMSYYVYITFLGYNCIPHLKNARFILAALPIIFIFYLVTVMIGWNLSESLMNFYHYRVL